MTIRRDRTGFGEITILQNPDAFCYGVDAVLLAGFAAESIASRKKKPMRALDLGTGTGIIPLILCHKTQIPDIRGIEVQRDSYLLAEENVRENGLQERLRFYNGDISRLELLEEENLRECFDIITSNPPYTEKSSGIPNQDGPRLIARQETTAGLREFLDFSRRALKDRGELFMVHRPGRTADLCALGRELNLEVKELCFVSGHAMEAPNIVLARLVKNGGRGLKILKPIYIREEDGSFSEDVLRYYERKES